MSRERLTDAQIDERLNSLEGWSRDGHALRRDFVFSSFITAFGWMASVALVAESMNHHPDWKNVYNRVEVTLSTHDAGGITELDFSVAREMNRLPNS